MPYILELPPDADLKLRQRASRRHMTPEEYLQAKMLGWLRPRLGANTRITPEEKEIIDALNAQLSRGLWERIYDLQEKARGGATEEERGELLKLLEQTEQWNVRRLTEVMKMARKRNMHMTTFMHINKIGHHPVAEEIAQRYRLLD
ncbi:MAG: hypothetical protein H7Y38_09665 [Armatimonadetes bacterium]|nr:hypothetical protein [Armatimonadota bacterium]